MMSSRKDPIIVALGYCPEKWNRHLLTTYGLQQDPGPPNEISETESKNTSDSNNTLEQVAGFAGTYAGNSELESEPTTHHKRSRAFMRVMVTIFACKNKLPGADHAALLKEIDDLPTSCSLPVFDDSLGSPEEFCERWRCHELDVRFLPENRDRLVFEIWFESIAPDKQEDLDGARAPNGHWVGLKYGALSLKAWSIVFLRIWLGAYCLLTSVYCLLAYMPYTYRSDIAGKVSGYCIQYVAFEQLKRNFRHETIFRCL